jgi:hypothetical protein
MLAICPDCHIEHESDIAPEVRCPSCHQAKIAEIRERTAPIGGQESPPPAGYERVPSESEKGKRLTKGLHGPNRPGMLPSQPDGLTWRQRAGQKSRS